LNIKLGIRGYVDKDFEFRRSMIRSVPYFRHLDDDIIEEIVYLLKPHWYDAKAIIINFGDITDKIHFLKQGEIEVTIPKRQGE
jgi:CRP-like cAMP-binding protein